MLRKPSRARSKISSLPSVAVSILRLRFPKETARVLAAFNVSVKPKCSCMRLREFVGGFTECAAALAEANVVVGNQANEHRIANRQRGVAGVRGAPEALRPDVRRHRVT
jgi:hypothetical protein